MSELMYNDSENQMNSKLILCIEEHDDKHDFNSIDTKMFVGWNHDTNSYFVRGKREDARESEFVPYAFDCDTTNELYDFIKFIVGSKRGKSLVLYNYNNLCLSCPCELTYEFFESHMDKNYEIAGYDNVKLKRHQICKYLRLLKNMYNLDGYEN